MSVCFCLIGCLSDCLSACLRVCLSVGLSVCRSVSLYLSVFLFVCLSVGLSVSLSVCVSVCLSVCLLVCLSACLSVDSRPSRVCIPEASIGHRPTAMSVPVVRRALGHRVPPHDRRDPRQTPSTRQAAGRRQRNPEGGRCSGATRTTNTTNEATRLSK